MGNSGIKIFDKEKLLSIVSDAVTNFSDSSDRMSGSEWLKGYLSDKLTQKSADEIQNISDKIIDSINEHERQKASLEKANSQGISTESWFAKQLSKSPEGIGKIAKKAFNICGTLIRSGNELTPQYCEDVIDAEPVPDENWNDDNWNEYSLKDALVGTADVIGRTGLKEIASGIFQNAFDDGFSSDSITGSVKEQLILNADSGLKTAVGGALKVADELAAVHFDDDSIIGSLAHKAVESVSIFAKVARGAKTITESIEDFRKTAATTITTMMSEENLTKIGQAIGSVFGPSGALIGGGIGGKIGRLANVNVGDSLKTAAHKVCEGVKQTVKETVDGFKAGFNAVKNGAKTLWNKAKSFFG